MNADELPQETPATRPCPCCRGLGYRRVSFREWLGKDSDQFVHVKCKECWGHGRVRA